MKTALMFYGLPRYVKRTFPKINDHIIKPNNADVFVHTWLDNSIINQPQQHYSDDTIVSDNITFDVIDDIWKLYEPKAISFGHRPNLNETVHSRVNLNSKLHRAIYEQHISGYKVNQLRKEYEREQNCQYDMVIRCRFDNYPHYKWVSTDYDSEVLHIPFRSEIENDIIPITDQMVWGSGELLSSYSDIIWNINEMINNGVPIQSEYLLHFHLIRFDIPFQRENFIISYTRYSDEI